MAKKPSIWSERIWPIIRPDNDEALATYERYTGYTMAKPKPKPGKPKPGC